MDINEFKVLRTRDLCQHLGLSSRTIERYRKRSSDENPFPEPDYPASGNSGNGWLASKVIAWQENERLRDKRKPMSHIHLPRDERGHFTRSVSA